MLRIKRFFSNTCLQLLGIVGTIIVVQSSILRSVLKIFTEKPDNLTDTNKDIKNSILKAGMDIPSDMLRYSNSELVDICNGCGAHDSWISSFIPNSIDDIDIRPCCNKHDFLFYIGCTKGDFLEANRTLLVDLLSVCDKYAIDNNLPLDTVRNYHDRVKVYFDFVDRYGYRYFVKETKKIMDIKDIIDVLPSD